MSNQPETNETAAPVQGRKVGLPRFFELMGRDLWPLYKSSFLCVLGFLPGTVLAVLSLLLVAGYRCGRRAGRSCGRAVPVLYDGYRAARPAR